MRTPLHEVKKCTNNKAGDVFKHSLKPMCKILLPFSILLCSKQPSAKKGGGHNDANMMNSKSLAKTLCFGGRRPVGKPTGREDSAFGRDT